MSDITQKNESAEEKAAVAHKADVNATEDHKEVAEKHIDLAQEKMKKSGS